MIRRPRARVSLVGALLVAVATGAAPSAAGDTLAERRAEADRVQRELDALDARLGLTVERYNAAALEVEEAEQAIKVNERRLAVVGATLGRAQQELATVLEISYRNGTPDAIQVVLGAGSISAALEQVDLLGRANGRVAELVVQIGRARGEYASRRKALERERSKRAAALAVQADEKQAVEAGLAARRARLSSIDAEIRTILDARARAEARASARAAERARARVADELGGDDTPDPGVGGSGETPDTPVTPSEPAPTIVVPGSSAGAGAANAALSQIGVPYLWAGESPSTGFDCSGLIVWAYRQVGIELPHYTGSIRGVGTPVPRDQLQVGDVVFFNGDGHAGIYLGDGTYVHSPQTGESVRVDPMDRSDYSGAVRIGA